MKTTFALLILFLSTLTTFAQETQYGLKAGANYSNHTGDTFIFEYDAKVGFYAGGFVNIPINQNFKIQPELLFSLQGTKYTSGLEMNSSQGDPISGDFVSRVNEFTLVLPVMAQYYITNSFYMEAGPQLDFIIDRTDEVIETPINDNNFNNVNVSNYDKFELGLAAGLGYDLTKNLILNVRYFHGVTARDFREVRSSVFYLGLNYKL